MLSLRFPVIAWLTCFRLAAAQDRASVVAGLKSSNVGLSSGTEIFLASDPDFANETIQRWTTHDAPSYIVSVKPAVESDVQKIIKFATNLHIPFLATGGGHGVATTFGKLQSGIQIDLGFFKNISIDAAGSTMTIGGGVLFREIFEPLYSAGKEIQTGSERCVGMVGATLGGGVGRYNGLHGMIADALLSIRLVTATGDIVTASASENSELFWGMRGAGFHFGTVVSATYQVYDLTNQGMAMNADFLFPANASTAVFQYFKSMENDQPAELSLIFITGYNPSFGGTYIVVNAAYAGPQDKGTHLIQPLIDAKPTLHNITTVAWKDLLDKSFFGLTPKNAPCAKGSNINVYGAGIKEYDIPTFQTYFTNLQQLWASYPDTRQSVFFIEAFPTQAVKAVPDEATAYPHRDITTHLLFDYQYTDASLEDTINTFAKDARSNFSATSGFDALRVYVSYGHGDEGPTPLYADRKLPRLRALKKKWDPKGVFSFNQPF